MKTRERSALSALAGLLLLFLLSGCGSTDNNTNNGKQIPSFEQAFYAQSILFTNNSTLMAAGYNGFGQLGNYTIQTPHPIIEPVFGLPDRAHGGVHGYAVGANHALAFGNNSTLFAWGCNYDGRLGTLQALPGLPQSGSSAFAPVAVPIQMRNTVTKVAAGWLHSMALLSDGSVYTWGGNTYGQLAFVADGKLINAPFPVPVIGPATPTTGTLQNLKITDIAAGGSHCLALANDGTVWSWGYNFASELGYPTLPLALFSPTPGQVSYVDSEGKTALLGKGSNGAVKAVFAAGMYSMALMEDHTLWAWGYNMYGQFGREPALALLESLTPQQVPQYKFNPDGTPQLDANGKPIPAGPLYVSKVSLGLLHVLAMESGSDGTPTGRVLSWGLNQTGQLGDGGSGFTRYVPEPVTILHYAKSDPVLPATDIYAFGTQSFARVGGQWWGWGDNTFGQMGLEIPVNTIAYRTSPVIWPPDVPTMLYATPVNL